MLEIGGGLRKFVREEGEAFHDIAFRLSDAFSRVNEAAASADEVFDDYGALAGVEASFNLLLFAVLFGGGSDVDHGFVQPVGKQGGPGDASSGDSGEDVKLVKGVGLEEALGEKGDDAPAVFREGEEYTVVCVDGGDDAGGVDELLFSVDGNGSGLEQDFRDSFADRVDARTFYHVSLHAGGLRHLGILVRRVSRANRRDWGPRAPSVVVIIELAASWRLSSPRLAEINSEEDPACLENCYYYRCC